MAAILGLDVDAVRAVCAEAAQGQVVEAVNLNAPEQTVIAGHASAVQRAADLCKAKGAKRAVMLPVSAPFHCALMRPAADRLKQHLLDIKLQTPQIPVINNVDVSVLQDVAQIKDALVRQAAAPVRWVETMQAMAAQGVTHVYECGPGKVLAGLSKRCAASLEGGALADAAGIETALEAIAAASKN